MKKTIFVLICIALVVTVLATAVYLDEYVTQPSNGTKVPYGVFAYDEWVSPDGVHYWTNNAGYHAAMAPRYDSNGELVIDR